MAYTELQAVTHLSFLRGASSCEELFASAAGLGYPALGITDHWTPEKVRVLEAHRVISRPG